MPLVTKRDIIVGVRGWLIAAGREGGIPNAQVVNAESVGVRPPVPFLTVRVTTYQNYEGRPERFRVSDGASGVSAYVRTQCRDTISVNAYGAGGEEWLARATQFLWQPDIVALNVAAGFTVEPDFGGAANLSEVLDDRYETRFQQDFAVSYAQLSDAVARTEATSVVVTTNLPGQPTFTHP